MMPIQQTAIRETVDQDWRNLSYDIGWEAGESGVIRCRTVLNRRDDIFRIVEGLNLREVVCDGVGKTAYDLLLSGAPLRHIHVRLAKSIGPDRLYMTAARQPGGAMIGTFSAIAPASDEIFQRQATFLAQMATARSREEGFRREAEIMLRGLRTLLGEGATTDKLKSLSALIVEAINGGENLVVQINRAGILRRLGEREPLARCGTLTAVWRNQREPVAVYGGADSHADALRIMLGVTSAEIALILMPVASESIAVICAPAHARGFKPADIGLAGRFAMILRQALVLKEEQDRLVQAAKLSALGQMSASLAHELRQPLNTISMAAQNLSLLVEAGTLSNEQLTAKIVRIQGQVDRASKIMDRIRRFSRRSGDQLSRVEVLPLAEGVQVLSAPALQDAGLQLAIDVPDGLTVYCDAAQIEQVLTNLVRNAADALSGVGSDYRTQSGAITVRASKCGESVILRVEDNGPGFPADMIGQQLETFFTTKDAESGTGLGLSICHTIAREHGGSLKFGNHASGAYVELHLPERDS